MNTSKLYFNIKFFLESEKFIIRLENHKNI